MLTGGARDYYFDHLLGMNLTFSDMIVSVKRLFVTGEHERTLLRK